MKSVSHGDTYKGSLEVEESLSPYQVCYYRLATDSGGAGRYRGGLGIDIAWHFPEGCLAMVELERSKCPPWGLHGGRPGQGNTGEVRLPDGTSRRVQKVTGAEFAPGTIIVYHTAGGGGWGDPLHTRSGCGPERRDIGLRVGRGRARRVWRAAERRRPGGRCRGDRRSARTPARRRRQGSERGGHDMASVTSASSAGIRRAGPAQWLWLRRYAILGFAAAFGLWEAAVRFFNVAPYLLPPPSTVVVELAARWPRVLDGAVITTQEILAGYLLAVVVSVPLALLITYSRTVESTLYPLIVFLQIVPKIAIAPLFIIWFGFGFTPKLLLVFLLSFFPIVVSSIAGFKSLDPDVMDLARSTGASEWLMFRKIRLPQALPSIFTGLKVGAALAATAAVVAEFVASNRGLGYLLLEYNGNLETAMVFAVILVLSAIGLLVYYAVELLEKLAIPWHVSQRATAEVSVV